MEINALPFEKIIFVCTNQRVDGERVCCISGGGGELRDKLKAMVKARQLRSRVRVSQSGCMDKCEDGPNIMVFPDNVWFSRVTEADLEPILDAVAQSLESGAGIRIETRSTKSERGANHLEFLTTNPQSTVGNHVEGEAEM